MVRTIVKFDLEYIFCLLLMYHFGVFGGSYP